MVMGEAKRLKNTPHAIDRDYPPEIATARKQLWPEVKRLRSVASLRYNIQLKYPAKIVKNGQILQDKFPHWDVLVKASVCGDFRYITQDELLLPETSVPGVQSMQTNSNVPFLPSESYRARNSTPGLSIMPPLQMPLMPHPRLHRHNKVCLRLVNLASTCVLRCYNQTCLRHSGGCRPAHQCQPRMSIMRVNKRTYQMMRVNQARLNSYHLLYYPSHFKGIIQVPTQLKIIQDKLQNRTKHNKIQNNTFLGLSVIV